MSSKSETMGIKQRTTIIYKTHDDDSHIRSQQFRAHRTNVSWLSDACTNRVNHDYIKRTTAEVNNLSQRS
jgi:hypothetical protein